MTDSPTTEAPDNLPSRDVPKDRRCLRCQATFQSEWSGVRICSRCKGSNAWRVGAPLRTYPSKGRQ